MRNAIFARPIRRRYTRRCPCLLLYLTAVFSIAAGARADSVTVRLSDAGGTGAPTLFTDVKVTNIVDGRMEFTTATGNDVSKDLSSVVAFSLDDEPGFNQAEQDFSANHVDRAVDEFEQTIQQTNKPWLKAYCHLLLTDAANKAGRFDKAMDGFIWLVMNEPAQAAQYLPTTPQAGSSYLDGAAGALESAVETPGIAPQQQAALVALQLNVDRARNDSNAIVRDVGRLQKLSTETGAATSNLASLALADAKLNLAASALAQKDYDQAAGIIQDSGDLFLDSRRQADALFILAQAREGEAQSKGDADSWRDAAIAYVRVVADFKDADGAPHVPQSLYRAAGILDARLNESGKALRMYQSIQTQFPQSPVADEAAQQIARLQAAGVRPD
jgi:tetratricopeptide (TPR) repeat protein